MEDSKLVKTFKRLSQGSKQSVQSGKDLDAFDQYMHVERPIEKAVRRAMDEIRIQGGGVLFLVGSAGDGKSHMIASLKKEYTDFKYRNDASESPDPEMEARDYLKKCLEDFSDATIGTTNTKLLVAINLGKLSELIDDPDIKDNFQEIVGCAKTLFDEDNLHHKQTDRVRIVSFGNHQIFELYPEKTNEDYPVDSKFIREVLAKITSASADNVFHQAYLDSKPIGGDFDPSYVNYELLCLPAVQDAIVNILIESIVRYKLLLTPRELFDFIYRIVVPDTLKEYRPRNFFESLLPSIFFNGGENKILKTIALLDPLKHGCIDHNNRLSDLFTSVEIPAELKTVLTGKVHAKFFDILTEFYHNNRQNIDDISKLIFRLEHLLKYHSESKEYIAFLGILSGYYAKDTTRFDSLYELISDCIPHYYGSYTDRDHIVPLNIQGREYKMFVGCDNLEPEWDEDSVSFDTNNRNQFVIEILTRWKVQKSLPPLKVEYQLYEDLCKIKSGKLTLANERDHNLQFGKFINDLVLQTDYQDKVLILTPDNKQFILKRGLGQKLTLR